MTRTDQRPHPPSDGPPRRELSHPYSALSMKWIVWAPLLTIALIVVLRIVASRSVRQAIADAGWDRAEGLAVGVTLVACLSGAFVLGLSATRRATLDGGWSRRWWRHLWPSLVLAGGYFVGIFLLMPPRGQDDALASSGRFDDGVLLAASAMLLSLPVVLGPGLLRSASASLSHGVVHGITDVLADEQRDVTGDMTRDVTGDATGEVSHDVGEDPAPCPAAALRLRNGNIFPGSRRMVRMAALDQTVTSVGLRNGEATGVRLTLGTVTLALDPLGQGAPFLTGGRNPRMLWAEVTVAEGCVTTVVARRAVIRRPSRPPRCLVRVGRPRRAHLTVWHPWWVLPLVGGV